jgi:hypothetical protein
VPNGRQNLVAKVGAGQFTNLGVGLRLMMATRKTGGCAPDRSESAAVQRTSTLLHKRNINFAVCDDGKWKLAVRLWKP